MMVTLTITLQAPDGEAYPFDVKRMDADSVYLEFGDSEPSACDGHAEGMGTERQWIVESTSVQVHPQAGQAFPPRGDNG
jgi:hypothetical protein